MKANVNVKFEAMENKLRIILEKARYTTNSLEDLEQELLNLHLVSESEHNEKVLSYAKNLKEFHKQINKIGENVKPEFPQTIKIVRIFRSIFLSSH